MQYYNNILTIEANWLIQNGIIGEANYRQLKARGDIQVVNRACKNTPALVAYESMPERFKRQVDAIVKDPYKAAKVNELERFIEHSAEASHYYDDYLLDDERHLPAEKRREYYANAIVLDAVGRYVTLRKGKRQALNMRSTHVWERIAESVEDLDRTKYAHALPANPRSLERKYKDYKANGYESLIHKSYLNCNRNAAKINDENKESVLITLMSDARNLDNAQVARLYNMMAEKMCWKKITKSAVAVWREKLDYLIYARRHGASSYRNNKAMQVKRSAPTAPLYYWTMDGWDAELLYQKTENGVTTYHNRCTVVIVLDACCKYPIGYAIGTHETPELIKEALRNATKHTEQLFGQMYRTAQLQSDRYSIKKMMPLYEGVAKHATPAQAHNAKAKIIEPWFNYFNNKYCKLQLNWSGYGVTSRKELQPNADFLRKGRQSFPDFEGVCSQIIHFVEMERAELLADYMSKYDSMPSEKRTPLPYEQYLMLFGATTGHKNLLQGSGLKITIGGQKRDYDCFNPAFRKYSSVRWEVRYDPDDLRHALAVNEDESLRFMLEEKYVQPMALTERQEGDAAELQRIREFNHAQEQFVAKQLSAHQETAAELISGQRELETLQKLMLCDSSGQHKNRRNKERLQPQNIDITDETNADEIFDVNDLLDEY